MTDLRLLHTSAMKPKRPFMSAIAAALLGLSACHHAHAQAERVLIAVEDDWAPYAWLDKDSGVVRGLAPQIVRESFATQQVEVAFLPVPFPRCLHYAATGFTVGCFNATIVSGNRDAYHWHPTPMFHEELAIFASKPADSSEISVADLKGAVVGLTIGYTYPTELVNDEAITFLRVTSDELQLNTLAAGRIQYAILNTLPAYQRIKATPRLQGRVHRVGRISEDGFWIAFSKARPDGAHYAALFESGLQVLRESGRLDALQAALRAEIGAIEAHRGE